MRRLRSFAAGVSLALVASFSLSAAAQGAHDPALAETLFNGAQACLASGDWKCACEKFAASMTADPSVSTLLNIAKCREHDGKLALAWATVQEALNLNQTLVYHEVRRKNLDEYGQKMAAALERRVPKLRISVAARPPGLEIRRDGAVIPVAALDETMRVDPGTHEIVVQAPGYAADRRTITIAEGQELQVSLALVPVPAPAPVMQYTPAPLVPMAAPRYPHAAEPDAPPSAYAQHTAGLALGGVGLVALATAGVLGIVTDVDAHDADGSAACQRPVNDESIRTCNAARDRARGVQTASIVTAVAGGVLVGAGVVLWATTPKPRARGAKQSVEWSVAAHAGGASVRGRF